MKKIFKTIIEKLYLNFEDNLAYTDELVKCKNKNYWLNYCVKKYQNEPLTLCLIDVNNLKAVNDMFGHDKGDIYLREMADLFKKYGTTIRFGGDEFAIIFHDTESIIKFKAMADSDIRIAYGIAFKTPNQSLSLALKNADSEMYKNKSLKKQSFRENENRELSSEILGNQSRTYLNETVRAEKIQGKVFYRDQNEFSKSKESDYDDMLC